MCVSCCLLLFKALSSDMFSFFLTVQLSVITKTLYKQQSVGHLPESLPLLNTLMATHP